MPDLVYSVAEHNILAKAPALLNSFLDLENYFLLNLHGLLERMWTFVEKDPAPFSV